MVSKENPHAGGGSVVLDIGDDIGALIVTMPAWMEDLEVEIIPSGTDRRHRYHPTDPHLPHADHEHPSGHHHGHNGTDQHGDNHGLPPHVAVVPRPAPDGSIIHSLVYGELPTGVYDLYVRPDGAVMLTAGVIGGQVTELAWPDT